MNRLTDRQREVLLHAAHGRTNAQIGRILGIDMRTVCRHLAIAYKRLDARDRTQAVVIALARGELHLDQISIPAQQEPAA